MEAQFFQNEGSYDLNLGSNYIIEKPNLLIPPIQLCGQLNLPLYYFGERMRTAT